MIPSWLAMLALLSLVTISLTGMMICWSKGYLKATHDTREAMLRGFDASIPDVVRDAIAIGRDEGARNTVRVLRPLLERAGLLLDAISVLNNLKRGLIGKEGGKN